MKSTTINKRKGATQAMRASTAGLLAFAISAAAPCAPAQELNVVSGQVTDSLNNPAKGVRVRLFGNERNTSEGATTNREGRFTIEHTPCKTCTLEVTPALKTGLSAVLIDSFPCERTRQFIIHLHKGFLVSGRVTYDGKGVKNISVRAVPEPGPTGRDIHGGGVATTDGSGNFKLNLTPGSKTLIVSNQVYSGLVGEMKAPFTVTTDTRIPDIIMPLKTK